MVTSLLGFGHTLAGERWRASVGSRHDALHETADSALRNDNSTAFFGTAPGAQPTSRERIAHCPVSTLQVSCVAMRLRR